MMMCRKLNHVKNTLKKGVKYILPIECLSIPTTLLSAFYEVESTFEASFHGFPFAWLEKTLGWMPSRGTCGIGSVGYVNLQNLALDIIFWSLIYGLPILGYKMAKRSGKKGI